MANRSYCRFENTAMDLQECVDDWTDDFRLSDNEIKGKKRIIEMAREIVKLEGTEDKVV